MPGLAFTPAQLATVLTAAALRPGVGSPLHALADAEPLAPGHPEYDALLAMTALRRDRDGVRPNRAVVSALRACAEPDEVLWIGTPVPGGSVTVCRRGRRYVDCSRRPDGRVSVVFPLDHAQVVLLAMAGLSGDRPELPPTGFALRAPLTDVFLLRLLADLAGDGPVERSRITTALRPALAEPERTLAIAGYGRRADLDRLVDDPGALDAALDRLASQSHLTRLGTAVLPDVVVASMLNAPVEAVFEIGRRRITTEQGARRLSERQLRVERRGGRLVVERVVAVDGVPFAELVERSRTEVRSLVGVFLLGDDWTRIAA